VVGPVPELVGEVLPSPVELDTWEVSSGPVEEPHPYGPVQDEPVSVDAPGVDKLPVGCVFEDWGLVDDPEPPGDGLDDGPDDGPPGDVEPAEEQP
jgi:hypothetical protein